MKQEHIKHVAELQDAVESLRGYRNTASRIYDSGANYNCIVDSCTNTYKRSIRFSASEPELANKIVELYNDAITAIASIAHEFIVSAENHFDTKINQYLHETKDDKPFIVRCICPTCENQISEQEIISDTPENAIIKANISPDNNYIIYAEPCS